MLGKLPRKVANRMLRMGVRAGKLPHSARILMLISPALGIAYGIVARSLPGKGPAMSSMSRFGVYGGLAHAIGQQVSRVYWR